MTDTTNKLFTLLDGRDVTVSPGTKRIPQEACATLHSSIELLETVKNDAENYRKQVIAECETVKEQAEIDGFQTGFTAWTEQLANLEKEITKVRTELQKTVMPVALKAAKKIVAAELSVNKQAIVEIVASTLKTIAQHKRITLYVSKHDFEAIEGSKNRLKQIFEELESLSIRERDDLEPGGCIVESEIGIINARLTDRWKTLEAAFEALTATLLSAKDSL